MAVTFLEPGGDADFGIGLWSTPLGTPAVATDFVHGGHVKSIKFRPGFNDTARRGGVFADSGSRFSVWVYIATLPGATASLIVVDKSDLASLCARIRITSAGVLQFWSSSAGGSLGSGATLSTGQWYRLSMAYTITSTTVNEFRVFVHDAAGNALTGISVTNGTLLNATTDSFLVGNQSTDATLDFRASDIYCDQDSSLTDPGNLWVTAKRPNANGTTNGFTTQIGSGGSGYGTGHSPQVNERPLSQTNGWSMVGAGSAVTEEYAIEGKATGDIDVSAATIKDFMGWVSAKSLAGETASLILAGATSNIALTSTPTIFTKVAGSSTYPGGATDIGIITTTALTTVSLYECGVVVGYIPAAAFTPKQRRTLGMLGTRIGTRKVA